MTQLSDRVSRLNELAYDLWWSWTTDARNVFRRLDYPLWRMTAHNPVRMLKVIAPETLERAINERVLTQAELVQANEVLVRLERFWAGSLGYAWRVAGPASDAA